MKSFSFFSSYSQFSSIGKILIWLSVFLIAITSINWMKKTFHPNQNQNQNQKEGFSLSNTKVKTNPTEIYDSFYVNIYDQLVLNPLKNNFELSQIMEYFHKENTKNYTEENNSLLDIGCGTGHHLGKLIETMQKKENIPYYKLKVTGIDISPAMIQQAQNNYPNIKDRFIVADVLTSNLFRMRSFSHISCFYFTFYYLKRKDTFFQNCIDWLKPGGYLFLHLVVPESFDPILPPGNPLLLVSPQRYAKQRITQTKIHFHEFEYQSNFQHETSRTNNENFPSSFVETFTFLKQPSRKQEHLFYMEPIENILSLAQEVGFIVKGKIDLIKVAYDNQFIYIFVKPN